MVFKEMVSGSGGGPITTWSGVLSSTNPYVTQLEKPAKLVIVFAQGNGQCAATIPGEQVMVNSGIVVGLSSDGLTLTKTGTFACDYVALG